MSRYRVTLIVTEACNMGCKYCYVPDIPQCQLKMSYEVIDASIKYTEDLLRSGKTVQLELFGGEPLVAWNEVKYAIEKSKYLYGEFKDTFNIKIFTNLTLLTKEKIIWLHQFNYVKFNFSLDGNRECHNSARVYKNGNGTYDDIIRNYQEYKRIYLTPYKIEECSMFTISPDNIDKLVDTVIEFRDKGVKSFYTCLVREDIWSPDDIIKYKNAINKVVDIVIDAFPKTGLIPLYMTYPYMEMKNKRDRFCGAGRTSIAITPTGDIYPCQRFYNQGCYEFKSGNIFTGIDDTNINFNIMKSIRLSHVKECQNCKYGLYPGCMTQCLAACYDTHGTLLNVIDSVCQINRINFDASVRLHDALSYNGEYQKILSIGV